MGVGNGGGLEEEVVLVIRHLHLVLKDDLDDQYHLRLQMEVEEALYLFNGEDVIEEAGVLNDVVQDPGVVTNGLLNFLWQVCNVRN